MRLLYTNANGLYNKLSELKTCLEIYNINIACTTETHFNAEVLDAEISITGFKFYRKDRDFSVHKSENTDSSTSSGGGSIIYVRENLVVELNSMFEAPDSVAIKVMTSVCVYRSISLNELRNELLLSSLSKICSLDNQEETLICGDLNLPNVNWVSGTIIGPSNTTNKLLLPRENL